MSTYALAADQALRAGRSAEALTLAQRACAADPQAPLPLICLCRALEALGRGAEAVSALEARLQGGGVAALWEELGRLYLEAGQPGEAVAALSEALRQAPDRAELWLNLGAAQARAGGAAAGREPTRRALSLRPGWPPALRQLVTLERRCGALGPAIALQRQLVSDQPEDPAGRRLLGQLLAEAGQAWPALQELHRAASLRPEGPLLHELGLRFAELGREEEARQVWRAALELAPQQEVTRLNLSRSLDRRGELREAQSLLASLDPSGPRGLEALEQQLWLRLRGADWRGLEVDLQRLEDGCRERLARGQRPPLPPLRALRWWADPALNHDIARAWGQAMDRGRPRPPRRSPGGPLRIGFLSADLRDHPVGHLISGLWPEMDPAEVAVVALSLRQSGDALQQELRRRAPRWLDLPADGPQGLARRIAELELDLIIDLGGHTTDSGLPLLAHRPAPLQWTWLGHPGPVAAPFLDAELADPWICPPGEAGWPEALRLPCCYQPNSPLDPLPPPPPRSALGLPEEGLVLGAFHQAWKLEPDTFDAWLELLRRLPQALLWLWAEQPDACDQLRARAGHLAHRLVFAPRLPRAEHLRRLQQVDIGLEPHRYGGHTSTSDLLRAGAPVLVQQGRHSASRVSSSLLCAAGLSELIHPDLDALINGVEALGREPERLHHLRQRLVEGRAPLYDNRPLARAIPQLARLALDALRGAPPVAGGPDGGERMM